MIKTSLALNVLVKRSISSYNGLLDFSESYFYNAKDDFSEMIFKNNDKITFNGKDINFDDCDFDFDYMDDIDSQIENCFKENLLKEIDFENIFKKYGLKFNDITIRKPSYYNFDDDELLINYEYDPDDDIENDLKDIIKDYIDNIRVKSYDGYCSFEPSDIDNVGKDDYCYIYAILKKENLIYTIKEIIDDSIEELVCNYDFMINERIKIENNRYKIGYDKAIDDYVLELYNENY